MSLILRAYRQASRVRKSLLSFENLDPSVSGQATYHDNIPGKCMSSAEEYLKSKQKKDEKPKEINLELGKGVAQKRGGEARLQGLEAEEDKPFAHSWIRSGIYAAPSPIVRGRGYHSDEGAGKIITMVRSGDLDNVDKIGPSPSKQIDEERNKSWLSFENLDPSVSGQATYHDNIPGKSMSSAEEYLKSKQKKDEKPKEINLELGKGVAQKRGGEARFHYVYSATPPSPCCDGSHEKSIVPVSEKACAEKKDTGSDLKSKRYYTHVERGKKQIAGSSNSPVNGENGGASTQFLVFSQADAKPVSTKASDGLQKEDNSLPSARTVLATEIECLVCQVSMCRLRHTLLSSSNLSPVGMSGLSCSSTPNLGHVDSSTMADNISSKSELKKKETIPVRIAGDIDGGMLDGSLTSPVGVWRSVGIPKAAKTSTSSMEVCPSIPHNSFMEEGMLSYGLRQPLQELLDGIALLVQQATSFVVVALDADCGDGPYGWLALQEQWRRGFSCGPSMVHAGCGGLMASSHSLDIAGMELVDPLSVDVQASFMIGLLQSDIKAALKSAFNSTDGPLSVTDWCRGRSPSIESGMTCDGHSAESIASASECRDSFSTVSLSAGDPMSPSLTSAGGASGLKADGTRGDEGGTSAMDPDQQHCSRIRPTLSVVPFPSILVGFENLDPSVSSQATNHDNIPGKCMSSAEEYMKSQQKKDEKPKEINLELGKGVAQKRGGEARLHGLEAEEDKPFAHSWIRSRIYAAPSPIVRGRGYHSDEGAGKIITMVRSGDLDNDDKIGPSPSKQIDEERNISWLSFENLDPSVSGQATYHDNIPGKCMSSAEEYLKSQQKKDEKPKEINLELGKGVAQKRGGEARLHGLEAEEDKPFAHSWIRSGIYAAPSPIVRGRGYHSDEGAGKIITMDDFRSYMLRKNFVDDNSHNAIGFGAGRFKFSVRWLLSVLLKNRACLGDLDEHEMERGILHGLWPSGKVLTPDEMRLYDQILTGSLENFDQVIRLHKELFLTHWPCVLNLKRIESSASFIIKEWKRHGKEYSIPLLTYVFHTLCLKSAFPNDFGIPVGVPMRLSEAGEYVRAVLKDLHLFGEHIGADALPEISTCANPYGLSLPCLIHEVRPHFERYSVDGTWKIRVVDVEETYADGKKMYYKGKANDGNNMVILPSCQYLERWSQ